MYVEVRYTGVITAPLLGSGSCPAWIASVSNFMWSPLVVEIIQEDWALGNADLLGIDDWSYNLCLAVSAREPSN